MYPNIRICMMHEKGVEPKSTKCMSLKKTPCGFLLQKYNNEIGCPKSTIAFEYLVYKPVYKTVYCDKYTGVPCFGIQCRSELRRFQSWAMIAVCRGNCYIHRRQGRGQHPSVTYILENRNVSYQRSQFYCIPGH